MLRRVPIDHIATQIATGRYEGRAYEVTELISGQSLQAAGFVAANNADLLRSLARELRSSLESFSQWGLRHRDLHPGNVQIRSLEPLDLVVTSSRPTSSRSWSNLLCSTIVASAVLLSIGQSGLTCRSDLTSLTN